MSLVGIDLLRYHPLSMQKRSIHLQAFYWVVFSNSH